MPVEEFGFERQSGSQIAVPRLRMYRAPAGGPAAAADRASLVFRGTADTFIGAQCHWDQSSRSYIQCDNGECCRQLGRPRLRVGAVLLVYARDRLWRPAVGWTVHPWLFSERTFTQLRDLNNGTPLVSHDMYIHSTDNQYQRLELRPASRCMWRESDGVEEFEDMRIAIWADHVRALEFIRQSMGRSLTDPAVVERRRNLSDANNEALDAVLREVPPRYDRATRPTGMMQTVVERVERPLTSLEWQGLDDVRIKDDRPPKPKVGRYELAKRRRIRTETDDE